MAKKRTVRWIGIEFSTTEEFYEFADTMPPDVRDTLIREEAYPVADGPDLKAIVVNDDIVGFGILLNPLKSGPPVRRGRDALARHVKKVLRSMEYEHANEAKLQER